MKKTFKVIDVSKVLESCWRHWKNNKKKYQQDDLQQSSEEMKTQGMLPLQRTNLPLPISGTQHTA